MPTQEARSTSRRQWAKAYVTPSPEIAEAIFEVAHYDEKLAEQIWEEGSDSAGAGPPPKPIKTACSGGGQTIERKTSRRFYPHPGSP